MLLIRICGQDGKPHCVRFLVDATTLVEGVKKIRANFPELLAQLKSEYLFTLEEVVECRGGVCPIFTEVPHD
jgi:hypothetical protein